MNWLINQWRWCPISLYKCLIFISKCWLLSLSLSIPVALPVFYPIFLLALPSPFLALIFIHSCQSSLAKVSPSLLTLPSFIQSDVFTSLSIHSCQPCCHALTSLSLSPFIAPSTCHVILFAPSPSSISVYLRFISVDSFDLCLALSVHLFLPLCLWVFCALMLNETHTAILMIIHNAEWSTKYQIPNTLHSYRAWSCVCPQK